MTKKIILSSAVAILIAHKIAEDAPLYKEITELLAVGKGGVAVDIESIVKRNEDGKVVELQCTKSGVWLPATLEYFFKDAGSKVINVNDEGLYKISRQADKIAKEFTKVNKASQAAITADVLDEKVTPAKGKALIANLPSEPDFSTVGIIVPVVEEAPETEEATA